jgi:hypothetical protein
MPHIASDAPITTSAVRPQSEISMPTSVASAMATAKGGRGLTVPPVGSWHTTAPVEARRATPILQQTGKDTRQREDQKAVFYIAAHLHAE